MWVSRLWLKWDIIAYSTQNTKEKRAVPNEMNAAVIKFSFDATFISVSLMVECSQLLMKFCLRLPAGGWIPMLPPPPSVSVEKWAKNFSHKHGPLEPLIV